MEAAAATAPMFGSSLEVPSVKELAAELNDVPPRYVREDEDIPVASEDASLPQVPVIDMHKFNADPKSVTLEMEKLHHACKDWGFFQVINHGVESSLVEKVKNGMEDFFNLPIEEKKMFGVIPGDIEGFGQAFVVSENQKLNWGDRFYMLTLPAHLRKPHLLPKLASPFRDAMEVYAAEVEKLNLKFMDLIAKNLGIETSYMKELFEGGYQSMRMNYYPPCPQPELVTGFNAHSDAVALTILLQINEMEGLQIKKDGKWLPIKPLPNAFIINIGDIIEIVTNGIYRSIEHRAMVNSKKERMSLAAFHSPKLNGEMGPAPSLLTPETSPLFKRIGVEEYFKRLFSGKLGAKTNLEDLRIH